MRLPTFALACVMATAAQADESTVLLTVGAWTATINVDADDGSLYCAAETANRDGTALILLGRGDAFTGGGLGAALVNDGWSLGQRIVSGAADVDYDRFTFDGEANENVMLVRHLSVEFITALQGGTAVAFLNASNQPVATFSLRGSRAVIGEWASCIGKLIPTTSTADPFAATGPTF